jgi:hypothetical protein
MSNLCYLYLHRGSCRICLICIYTGAHVAFVLFVFIRELMSHLSYLYLYRGSCRMCVICICIGAHVAFVLFVFV